MGLASGSVDDQEAHVTYRLALRSDDGMTDLIPSLSQHELIRVA
jgi:hypothetical protein